MEYSVLSTVYFNGVVGLKLDSAEIEAMLNESTMTMTMTMQDFLFSYNLLRTLYRVLCSIL